jgi:hypothetical protein
VKNTGTFLLFRTSRIQDLEEYKQLDVSEFEAVRLIGGMCCRHPWHCQSLEPK